MAFQSAKRIGGQEMIRVDYERYLLGEENLLLFTVVLYLVLKKFRWGFFYWHNALNVMIVFLYIYTTIS